MPDPVKTVVAHEIMEHVKAATQELSEHTFFVDSNCKVSHNELQATITLWMVNDVKQFVVKVSQSTFVV